MDTTIYTGSLFLTFLSLIIGVNTVCGPGNSYEFEEVLEANYDMTYADITAPGTPRPLGFNRNHTVYGQPERNPCIVVTGVADRHVEVMFQTIPAVPLCYKVNGEKNTCEASGKYQKCLNPLGTSQNIYEFYVDSGTGSSESDVTFWYRITKGKTMAEDSENYWCMERKFRFPGDLMEPPLNFTVPKETSTQANSSPLLRNFNIINSVFLSYVINLLSC